MKLLSFQTPFDLRAPSSVRRQMLQTMEEQRTAAHNGLLLDSVSKQTPGLPGAQTEKHLTELKKSHISSAQES